MRKKTVLILVLSLVFITIAGVVVTIVVLRRDAPAPITQAVPTQEAPAISNIDTLSVDEVKSKFTDTAQAFDSLMSRAELHYFVGDYSSSLEFFNASADLPGITQEQRESALARLYMTYKALGQNDKMTQIQERMGDDAFNRLNAPIDDLKDE